MIRRIVLSVVVGVVTALVAALAGTLLESVNQETIRSVGNFLQTYSFLLGVLAAIWYFFTGETPGDKV